MGADLGSFHLKKPRKVVRGFYDYKLADLRQQLVEARFRVAVKHPGILFVE